MAAWVKFLYVFIISAIFSIGLLTFIYNIQTNNNSAENIYDDNSPLKPFASSNSLLLDSFNEGVTNQYNASSSESVTAPTGAFIMFSILTSLGRFAILPATFMINLNKSIAQTIGIPDILNAILAMVILAGIFYWYYSVKTGS